MSQARTVPPPPAPRPVFSKAMADQLIALTAEAVTFIAVDKAETMAHRWLMGAEVHDKVRQTGLALTLAIELALCTPSLLGVTAFDRLARAKRNPTQEMLAALTLLRRSRLRLARVTGDRFEDLASGETLTLLGRRNADTGGDGFVFGRFAPTGHGCVVAASAGVLLNDATLAVARGFIRAGRRELIGAVRCGEAVFRHIVRTGVMADGQKLAPQSPFHPEADAMDALAERWASRDAAPGPEELAKARGMAGGNALLNALTSVLLARRGRMSGHAEAYCRIAVVIMETMSLRAAQGSSRMSLGTVAAEIDAEIARGTYPPEMRGLFDDLRERARMAARRPDANSGDIDKLIARIRALRAKTVERGCTEQEALAAAEKVAELLDRHGLSLSELDLRKQHCEGIGVETNRKRRGPIDDCMSTIASFFDSRVWSETGEDGTIRYIFFGLPGDVQAAVYLHDLIAMAFATETAAFQAGAIYAESPGGHRRSATNSFQIGLAHGIIGKLQALRGARDGARGGSGGRALVPIKESMIEQELEQLGLSFRSKAASRRRVLPGAFKAGKEAGERFDYRPGIDG